MPYKGWKKPGSELEEKLQQFDLEDKKAYPENEFIMMVCGL